ncbi:MAG: hypothetical protein JKY65_13050, partial [Planctomycetes bacterium]|nr:hypothetical protein [Planctomycetota bacterium]
DDPRAQPRPAPSLRQLSDLIEERSARDTAVSGALDVPDAAAGGLDAILAQATELTFEGYEEELASLLEETYERYQSGTFALFPGEPAPGAPPQATPTARRDSPLANWRPPPMPDLPSPSRPPAPVSWGPELPPRVPPPTRPFARDPSLAEPPRAAQAVHDPFVEDPFELLPSAADPAAATIQGFGEQLLRHGAGGMLERKNPPRGQAVSVPIRTVFDPSRSLFGAPLEPRLEPGDRFQLRDGQIYRVIESEFVFVGETPCYQEVRAQPLGSLRVPLHKSWEGNFPT